MLIKILKDVYKNNYEKQFDIQYIKLHGLEKNKLRNLANLYGHLLYTETIDWMVLNVLNEQKKKPLQVPEYF